MMLMNNRAQVSVEFIITIIFVMVVFVFGLMLFQNQLFFNQNFQEELDAKNVSNRMARNISNTFLMTDGSLMSDHIFWDGIGKKVEIGARSVRTFYSVDQFAETVFLGDVEWNITDVNGEIFFKKEDGRVIVSYG